MRGELGWFMHDQQKLKQNKTRGSYSTDRPALTTAGTDVRICNSFDCLARLGVVHPVQNDLRCPVPTGHHVARHLGVGAASQPKVQDLRQIRRLITLLNMTDIWWVNTLAWFTTPYAASLCKKKKKRKKKKRKLGAFPSSG